MKITVLSRSWIHGGMKLNVEGFQQQMNTVFLRNLINVSELDKSIKDVIYDNARATITLTNSYTNFDNIISMCGRVRTTIINAMKRKNTLIEAFVNGFCSLRNGNVKGVEALIGKKVMSQVCVVIKDPNYELTARQKDIKRGVRQQVASYAGVAGSKNILLSSNDMLLIIPVLPFDISAIMSKEIDTEVVTQSTTIIEEEFSIDEIESFY